MQYDPSMGAQALQRSMSKDESKKKAAMDLGFDEEELADRGVDDDDEEEDEEGDVQTELHSHHHQNGAEAPLSPSRSVGHSDIGSWGPTSPAASTASRRVSTDHDGGKLQTQLDLLKRVNAQLTKDKETLTRQLQHARQAAGHRPSSAAAPTASPQGKPGQDTSKALQLLTDAEDYIATLRESSCAYLNTIRQERQAYQQGSPTVVQQLQKELAAARAGAPQGKAVYDSVSSQGPGFWKEECEKLSAQLQVKDRTISELQKEVESADRDADQADLDMQRLAEQHKQAESDLQRLQQRLEALSSTPPASAADTQAALARKDEQIQELTAQLEAQKNTIGMMDGLLQDKEAKAGANRAEALAACKKEVHHHMKKLKKLQHAVTADAEAFAEMVSPDGWGVLMERALHGAASLQKKIEGAAQEEARRRFAAELAQAVAAADAAKDKWRKEHERRKALHNQLIELKGNIRVLCRVRPLSSKEQADAAQSAITVVDEQCIQLLTEKGAEKEFEFNRCFDAGDSQESVYSEVSSLVTSVIDGYNCCIMAYGQTGSGKTHTMEGPPSDPGVNTRALQELFDLATARAEDFDISVSTSVLEIYNEDVKDLLSGARESLTVRAQWEGLSPVDGLSIREVADMTAVQATLQTGKSNRSTFATNMNEHSSRSHLVLSVYVTCANRASGAKTTGKLHLVDLAGSERLSKTGATGDRLKEAQNINKSLSSLGDVIAALQQRSKHIPYRNSKLTHLLQDSLGGNSKVLMFVNCSPASTNAGETLCSLNFAARASKVELGKASASAASGTASPASQTSLSRNTSQSALAT